MFMVTSIVDADGTIRAECPNPAVAECVLGEIHEWTKSGASSDDVIDRLRTQTFLQAIPFTLG